VPGRPVSWTAPPETALRAAVGLLHRGPERKSAEHAWLVEAARDAGMPWPDPLGGRGWPAALRHGDLTGGHVLLDTDGTVRLVDWEYGAIEGFPWVDLAHFVLQAAALVRRTSPESGRKRAVRALARRGWPGLDPGEADAIVRLAAFAAERDGRADGHADGASLQAWRRAVWSA
jgi:thiamine kinase-like enzyme